MNAILTKGRLVLVILCVITLPFFTVLNSALLISVTVLAIIQAATGNSVKIDRWTRVQLIVYPSLFLLYFIWIVIGFQSGHWSIIEKKFGLLALPLAFAFSGSFSKEDFMKILWALLLSITAGLLATFIKHPELIAGVDLDIDSYLVMRRPYFGLYLLTAALVAIYFAFEYTNRLVRFGVIVIALLLIYGSWVLYTKMALLSFAIAIIVTVTTWLLVKKRYRQLGILSTLFVVVMIGVFAINDELRTIVTRSLSGDPFDLSGEYKWIYFLSMNMRFAIWDCSWHLISEGHNWLTGVGLDHQQYLDQCYQNPGLWTKYSVDVRPLDLENSVYNAHNEYLSAWLDFGIIGPIALIATFVCGFISGLRNNNFLYIAFLVLFFGCCASETMLSVQRGIVLYALLNSLFFNQRFLHRTEQL